VGASERARGCPADIAVGDPNLADPWVLGGIGDPNQRLAGRNRDGVVCPATLQLLRRPVGRALTDNAIGDPTILCSRVNKEDGQRGVHLCERRDSGVGFLTPKLVFGNR
jgi:hypothetical protein